MNGWMVFFMNLLGETCLINYFLEQENLHI